MRQMMVWTGLNVLLSVTLMASDIGAGDTHAEQPLPAVTNTVQTATPDKMEPIMVTSTLTEMELKDVPLTVSVITAEDVRRSVGANVADLLRDVPGVEVYDGAISGLPRVSIRGESDRTLILVDGQRISEQKSMSGAPILIAKADIERIEVIKGPGSTLYGSEAIGGVVNIITKKAAKDGFDFTVGGTYDSGMNGVTADSSVSGRLGAYSYYASSMYQLYGKRDTPLGKLDRTESESISYAASVGYDDEKTSAGVRFEEFNSELEVYTDSDYMYMDLPEWSRDKVSAFVEQRDLTEYLAKVRVSGYYQNTIKDFINDITWSRMMGMPGWMSWTEYKSTYNDQDAFGVNMQSDFVFGDHYLIAGGEFIYDHLRSDDYTRTYQKMTSPAVPGVTTEMFSYPHASKNTAALFAQDEWRFLEGWSLTAGYRANYTGMAAHDDPAAGRDSATSDDYHGTFSTSLVNTQLDDWTFRAGVAQGYRSPTLGERYTSSGMAGQYISGNPDLDSETSLSYELGARWFTDSITFDISSFYTEAEDYIDYLADATAPTGYRWFNMEKAKTFGGEMLLKYDFYTSPDVELAPYVSGTLLRRKYTQANGSATYDTGYPIVRGRGGLRAQRPFTGNVTGWIDLYTVAATAADEGSSTEPGWTTYNVTVGADIERIESLYIDRLSIELGFLNMSDTEYTQPRDSIMAPGQALYVAVRATF